VKRVQIHIKSRWVLSCLDFDSYTLSSQEDDGLRKRKVTSASAPHGSNTMATTAMRDEGLSTRVLALCLLFFVIGAIIGKLVL